MNIQEIRNRKFTLATEIAELVSKFNVETETLVEAIDLKYDTYSWPVDCDDLLALNHVKIKLQRI